MTEPSPQPVDAVAALHAGCRRWLVLLSELTVLHVAIDTPERQAAAADEGISLRLRKAYFHVAAVLDWPIDTLIVHVMGPEIRTAMRHLTPIVSEFLYDLTSTGATRTSQRPAEASRRLLDAVSHPTPQVLIHPRHLGGLAHAEPGPCLTLLYGLLADLTFSYATALGALAERLNDSKMQDITAIIVRCGEELASVPVHETGIC